MFQKQQKLKAIGAKKLGLLQLEISIETKKTKKSIKNAVKIATLEQKTSYKIKEIQLKILSIHFTIDELLKN